MKPYYEADGVTIYHGDCKDVWPSVECDAILTDPPYGLGGRWTGGTWATRGVWDMDELRRWDRCAPLDLVAALVAQGTPAIFWGGNNFYLPPSRCWLAWIKTNSVRTMADMELAWTNLDRPAKKFSHPCNGWKRSHPTEKPIALIEWCISFLPGGVVLDPFMGSGTTLVAAKNLGRKAIGIEIEERYCEIATERLAQTVMNLDV